MRHARTKNAFKDSDQTDAQADLSLRWAHMQSCRKCFVPAQNGMEIDTC